jgi:hypothetical protein
MTRAIIACCCGCGQRIEAGRLCDRRRVERGLPLQADASPAVSIGVTAPAPAEPPSLPITVTEEAM